MIVPEKDHVEDICKFLDKKGAYVCSLDINLAGHEIENWENEYCGYELRELGCKWTMIANADRRMVFQESEDICALKLKEALYWGVNVIISVGENKESRLNGTYLENLCERLEVFRDGLTKWHKIVLCYEVSMWAWETEIMPNPEIVGEAC